MLHPLAFSSLISLPLFFLSRASAFFWFFLRTEIKKSALLIVVKMAEQLIKFDSLPSPLKLLRMNLLMQILLSPSLQFNLRKIVSHGLRVLVHTDKSKSILAEFSNKTENLKFVGELFRGIFQTMKP